MKKIMQRIGIAGLLFAGVTWFCVMAQPQKSSPKIQWMNDAIYYHTNHWAYDEERNKTNSQPSNFYFTKTVISTNKTTPFYFRFGDRDAELGAREDGVIVWRYRE